VHVVLNQYKPTVSQGWSSTNCNEFRCWQVGTRSLPPKWPILCRVGR